MKKYHLLFLLTSLFLTSCGLNSSSNPGSQSSDNKTDVSVDFGLKSPDFETPKRNSKDEFTFDDFFNLGNTVLINVDVSEEELQLLQQDYEKGYKTEIYRRADHVTISIINFGITYTWEFDNVGLRQKGNTSRKSIFSGDGETLNQNHFKLAFDEKFNDPEIYDASYIAKYGNEEYDDREFLEMSGIDIKWNKNFDNTHFKEAYSSYLYHAAGIITPHVGLSKMVFNYGDKTYDFGLCMTFEKASKSMIKRSLKEENVVTMTDWNDEKKGTFSVPGENYGDLYKCSYGVGEGSSNGADLTSESIRGKRIGVGNLSGSYIPTYERKTHDDIDYDDTLLTKFIIAINNSSATYDSMSAVVDMEYLAIQQAVGYIVGNPDDMRYNYNNYMIYLRRTDGKAIFIPIDNDRCFGITKDWNVREALMYDTVLSSKPSSGEQRNPLLNKTIFAQDNECKKLYLDYVNKIINSDWVKVETFDEYYTKVVLSYRKYLREDEVINRNDTNISFATYMENKIVAAKDLQNK